MTSTPFFGESGRCWSKLHPVTILPPRVIRRLSTGTVPVEQRARETHRGLAPTLASKTRRKVWSETGAQHHRYQALTPALTNVEGQSKSRWQPRQHPVHLKTHVLSES